MFLSLSVSAPRGTQLVQVLTTRLSGEGTLVLIWGNVQHGMLVGSSSALFLFVLLISYPLLRRCFVYGVYLLTPEQSLSWDRHRLFPVRRPHASGAGREVGAGDFDRSRAGNSHRRSPACVSITICTIVYRSSKLLGLSSSAVDDDHGGPRFLVVEDFS